MELNVYNKAGADTGKKVTLDEAVFGIEPNDHAIYLDVKRYLAGQRQGTHKTKERGEIVGSTKKIKRQKGTGTARAGSVKSPIFRGGGRAFGPRPRNYNQKVNKKVKQLARRSALTYKAKDNNLRVIESFTLEVPKTKEIENLRKALQLDKKVLLVINGNDKNLYLSTRNLPDTKLIDAADLNTYTILNHKHIVFFEEAVEKVHEVLNAKKQVTNEN